MEPSYPLEPDDDDEPVGQPDDDEPVAQPDDDDDEPKAALSRSEASELADLKFHWDEAYRIDWADGVYRAARIDQPSVVLTSESCDELRQQIRDDYANWQLSRLHERSSL
jgi:hypothetical protein